ncbi:MAG: hypothetical protein ABR990_09610 [Terracidiphilus sp.]|jgi:hypothetical protein
MRTDLPLNSPVSHGILCARGFVLLAVLAATLGGAQILQAQAPATAASSTPAHKTAHPHKHSVAAQTQSPTPPAAAKPPEPELPKWPANEKPSPASVTWDSQGLRIDAANSSLAQILQDVATATGAKVEGFDSDQRVFGAFGPGPARDVLSQLLQGSGYNVLLIGDQGQGTPREILLSHRHAGTATAAVNPAPASDEDSDTDEQPQPGQPPIRPGSIPGRPLTPQQMQQQRPQPVQPQPGHPQPGQPPSNPQN